MIHGSGFIPYRYFSLGFKQRRMHFENDSHKFIIRVVQRHHGGSFMRPVWNLVITLFGNSTTNRDEIVGPYF
jgi:hypothetical protein